MVPEHLEFFGPSELIFAHYPTAIRPHSEPLGSRFVPNTRHHPGRTGRQLAVTASAPDIEALRDNHSRLPTLVATSPSVGHTLVVLPVARLFALLGRFGFVFWFGEDLDQLDVELFWKEVPVALLRL